VELKAPLPLNTVLDRSEPALLRSLGCALSREGFDISLAAATGNLVKVTAGGC
jgi:hypothetical protein